MKFAILGKIFATRKEAYDWLIPNVYAWAIDYFSFAELLEKTDEETTEELLDILGEEIYVKDGEI